MVCPVAWLVGSLHFLHVYVCSCRQLDCFSSCTRRIHIGKKVRGGWFGCVVSVVGRVYRVLLGTGMDTYASVLWHLRDEIPLSILVEDLTSSNKLRPEVWLVMLLHTLSLPLSICLSVCLSLVHVYA